MHTVEILYLARNCMSLTSFKVAIYAKYAFLAGKNKP